MRWIRHPSPTGTLERREVGGKAHALARLHHVFGGVPPFFVLVPEAFVQSARHGTDKTGAPLLIDPAVDADVEAALARFLPRGRAFAVRSSAPDEDGAVHSFAGQMRSFLDVPREGVGARVLDVWRSAITPGVRGYREARGLTVMAAPPAVIVQAMVAADSAGVAFGSDATAGRSVTIVCATRGLGDGLVDGREDGDLYLAWPRDGHTECRAAEGAEPVLSDGEVLAVARRVEAIREAFGSPQDVEWAFEGGTLHLLQARPVTAGSLPSLPPRKEALWDNSNIAESYPGISTPCTFSFIRRAYEEVYRGFARVMGVSDARISEEGDTFRNMLGYHRGRVFYNLLNWYRVVAMVPGYAANQHFLEEMLGVDRALTADARARVRPARSGSPFAARLNLARMVGRIAWNFLTLRRAMRRWQARLDDALGDTTTRGSRSRIEALSPQDLVARYRHLERRLLTRWHTPIVNDFFGMVFHGLLRRLAVRWCDDHDGTLANGVLCAAGDVISAQPAAEARALASLVRGDERAQTALERGRVPASASFVRAYEAWLDRFGDRCTEELKLESPTLRDDPAPLLRTVAVLARGEEAQTRGAEGALHAARAQARRRLRWHPLRRIAFGLVHAQARSRLRARENLRFERTRLFGEVRRIVRALGERLFDLGALAAPADVFFLELEEVLGFVEGTASSRDLAGLVAVRRAERRCWEQHAPPPARFWTHAIADVGAATTDAHHTTADEGEGPTRSGLGLSPGIAQGRVRVVQDPRTEAIESGEILVARRTDPGWILAFAAARALVVEHGSLLSHVAIVARELGVPAVTQIGGAAAWLRTGDLVEVDGDRGTVTCLERADAAEQRAPEACRA